MPEIKRCRLVELLTAKLLVQILIRLPLESLLVCRRVCKSWKDLIAEPSFVELHRSFSRTPLTIMVVCQAVEELDQPIEFGLITENKSISSSYQYDLKYTDEVIVEIDEIEMVGSCNGLICLSSFDYEHYESFDSETSPDDDNHRLVLWNPILGSHSHLPDPPRVSKSEYCRRSQFGFGYVPSTKQYKAVKIVYQKPRKTRRRRLLFHVYTIPSGNKKANKKMDPFTSPWRTICYEDGSFSGPGLQEISDSFSYPTCFKGSIIWIAKSPKKAECQFLICFDLEKEQLQTFPLPSTIRGYNRSIGVYYDDDGYDHLYLCERLVACANIWVMEDDKSIDSLKLKWVIQLPPPKPVHERKPVQLFKVLKDGELLIGVQESTLAYYDPNTKALETVKNVEFRSDTSLAADTPNLLGCLL